MTIKPSIRTIEPEDLPEEVQQATQDLQIVIAKIGMAFVAKLVEGGTHEALAVSVVSSFLMKSSCAFIMDAAAPSDDLRAAFRDMALSYYDTVSVQRLEWEAKQDATLQ